MIRLTVPVRSGSSWSSHIDQLNVDTLRMLDYSQSIRICGNFVGVLVENTQPLHSESLKWTRTNTSPTTVYTGVCIENDRVSPLSVFRIFASFAH